MIWVPGGYGRPYKASKDVLGKEAPKSSKYYYIRKFSSTIVASPEEEKELFYISTDIPFDDRPNLAAEVEDLDIGLMRSHLKEIGSSLYERSTKMSAVEIAADMQLISGSTERMEQTKSEFEVTVSPQSITLKAYGNYYEAETKYRNTSDPNKLNLKIDVHMSDGTVQTLPIVSGINGAEKQEDGSPKEYFTFKFIPETPIKAEDIEFIQLKDVKMMING